MLDAGCWNPVIKFMGFYEELAENYDDMTRFDERVQQETAVLKGWVDRYQFRTVVDVACGTGIHAIILAKLGIRTVGADISEAMLEKAKSHTEEFGVQVSWIQSAMEQVRQEVKGEYGAVFCLGNSIPHLLTPEALDAAVGSFSQLLSPGGIVVIQLLNYHRILAEQNRVIGIHRQGATEFIRFYDFHPDMVQFNILSIHWQNGKATHTFNSTPLYPYQKHELEQALSTHRFSEFEHYGDMRFHPFEEQTSPNLVIVGKKTRSSQECKF